MTVSHATLTGTDLHEPKGIASATSGQLYVANGSGSGAWSTVATPVFMYKHIAGLTWQNDAGDTNNSIQILSGKCRDTADTADMINTVTLSKKVNVNWVVGTAQGGLDTGTVGNNTYHIWLIKRSDTGVVDALFSLSATAPSMPANYDKKRRIGSFVRIAGVNQQVNVQEIQGGGTYTIWKTPSAESGVTTTSGTGVHAVTLAKGPTGVSMEFLLNSVTSGTSITIINPSYTIGSSMTGNSGIVTVLTNSSGQYAYSNAGVGDTLTTTVLGWKDFRRD